MKVLIILNVRRGTSNSIEIIKDFSGLSEEDIALLYSDFSSPEELEAYANSWGENVIGKFSYFPLRVKLSAYKLYTHLFIHCERNKAKNMVGFWATS